MRFLEVKGDKPRVTLLHHLVKEAEEKQPDILKFLDDLYESLADCKQYVNKIKEREGRIGGGIKRKIYIYTPYLYFYSYVMLFL